MTQFRLDVSKETGAVTLWMATGETICGYKPVLAWPNTDCMKDFARTLLELDTSEESPCWQPREIRAS